MLRSFLSVANLLHARGELQDPSSLPPLYDPPLSTPLGFRVQDLRFRISGLRIGQHLTTDGDNHESALRIPPPGRVDVADPSLL